MNTKKQDTRKRIELCEWSEGVPAAIQSKGDHYSAKAKCHKVLTEADVCRQVGVDEQIVLDLLTEIGKLVATGYDVQLCKSVHFYACVEKLETPVICAKTMGLFRRSISGKSVRPTRFSQPISMTRVKEMNREARRKRNNVTPDTVVTCPNCGTEFRVGKMLG